MYEKEDAPTERVKLLTLLSGEEEFELSRWDIHISALWFGQLFYPPEIHIIWDATGQEE